eukprot:CAMPEP_0197896052 /NCGR_PEP_ID=MMETSP1439-20131203/38881_1 /TAXON_ID=66791 /ORGANISM="Gonyaulax spinifera, Strain CCMP409" /LENGTH=211 /DNA_ID=CAMNT_0043516535 /DNA_START=54 /DNA_END=686 /DNA_ORIENTATION=+
MEHVTLHFSIFQAGASAEGKRSLRVEDPRGITIGSLKRQLFAEALEQERSIRFIASGRILQDAEALERCNLGTEAFIHVSIGDARPQPAKSCMATPSADGSAARNSSSMQASISRKEDEEGGLSISLILGAVFFAGTGVMLQLAWQKRWHLSMHASQLLCIFAAVWVYLLICHGVPALFQSLVLVPRALCRLAAPSAHGDATTDAAPCATG